MLPGITPAAAEPPFALVPVAVATADGGATIAWPAAPRAGDLAILFDAARNDGDNNPTAVVPAGFTAAYNQAIGGGNNNALRCIVSTRICAGGEAGSLTGLDSANEGKVLALFRPTRPIASVVAFGGAQNGGAGDQAAISVAIAGRTAPAIAWGLRLSPSGGLLSGPAGATYRRLTNVDVGWLAMAELLVDTSWDIDDAGNWNGIFVGGLQPTLG